MKVSVWDTYVKRVDGKLMHFDILVSSNLNNEQTILNFGNHYLKNKPFKTNQLTSNECRLCHVEQATEAMISSIEKKRLFHYRNGEL